MRYQLDSSSLDKTTAIFAMLWALTVNCNFILPLVTTKLSYDLKYTTGSFPKWGETLASGWKSQAQFFLCPVHTQPEKDSLCPSDTENIPCL